VGDFLRGIRVPELNLGNGVAPAASEYYDRPPVMICPADAQEPISFRRHRGETRSCHQQQEGSRHDDSLHGMLDPRTKARPASGFTVPCVGTAWSSIRMIAWSSPHCERCLSKWV
jgi:hypothetical protein